MGPIIGLWIAVTLVGVATWPLLYRWCGSLIDRGWSLSKIAGLVLVWVLVWWTGHLALSALWVRLIGLVLVLIGSANLWLNRKILWPWLRHNWRAVILSEAVFALVLVGFGLAREGHPAILGTEKPMDYMILQSIIGAHRLPPADAWFAGSSIAYYWGGYLFVAMIGWLGFVAPATIFVLAPALVAALGAQLVWGIAFGLTKKAFWALWAPVILLGGNLAGALAAFKGGFGHIDWWAPSRVFAGGITEFPSFSVLLGDVHPHLIALPLILAVVTLSLMEATIFSALGLGILIGMLWVTNPWSIVGAGLLAAFWWYRNAYDRNRKILRFAMLIWLVTAALSIALVGLGGSHTPLPGIGFSHSHTPVGGFGAMFGLLFAIGAVGLLAARRLSAKIWQLAIVALVLVALPEIVYLKDFFGPPLERMNTIFKFWYDGWIIGAAAIGALAAAGSAALAAKKTFRGIVIIIGLGIAAILLAYPVNTAWTLAAQSPNHTANGEAWLLKSDPDVAGAIEWVRGHLQEGDVVAEPAPRTYELDAPFSTYTGRPTIIGWPQHEALWRGSWDESQQRVQSVNNLYLGAKSTDWAAAINQYKIRAVVVYKDAARNLPTAPNDAQRFSYNNLVKTLSQFGTIGFDTPTVTLFMIKGSQ